MSDISFIDKIARMLNVSKDDVQSKIAGLEIDQVLELVDAAGHGRADVARSMLDIGETDTEEAQDDGEAIDDENNGEDVEADTPEETPLNPLFDRSSKKSKPETSEDEVEEAADDGEAYTPNIGDTVRVAGHKGTVKIPHGPADTVGVLIDGENTMVHKSKIRRDTIEEGVMGMSPMIDLRRMQELAGLVPAATTPLGAGAVQIGFDPEDDDADVETMTADAVNDDGDDRIEIISEPSDDGEPCSASTSLLDDPQQLAAIVAAGATSAHYPESPCLSFGGVLQSFDEIERALPELRMRDAKEVRGRINGILAKLNETAYRRRLKP